ncbi:nitrate reductase [Bifidobacterium adolescentis]|uniref:nitrate reductase n=1 Tax=Bifidobacterium adolescentis TaxID=1680 RepID=UPI00232CD37F|nr:nitrate reductase [Bifidobacterium adolescentis]MDB1515656.1 nitrate reductase [Bifidobacterium adolescentis]MDB1517728.1 nitrate reductase [Bifidobacterium adolescentis]
MLSATFEMDDNGLCIIRCDPPVNGSDSFVFTPDVVASWKALLGLASTREAIAAIMQGREDVSRYDPKTGRGVWTGAFEALESALADSATSVSMLAADGEVLDDPLTAARNRTREGMSLPVMSNETDARMCAALTADGSGVEASSGIDVACTRDVDGLDAFLEDKSSQSMLDECEERFYEALMPRQNQQN